jgi:hypothetical protein
MTLVIFISYALLDGYQAVALTGDVRNCSVAAVVFARAKVYTTVPLEVQSRNFNGARPASGDRSYLP